MREGLSKHFKEIMVTGMKGSLGCLDQKKIKSLEDLAIDDDNYN
jgi:hypothetical protein